MCFSAELNNYIRPTTSIPAHLIDVCQIVGSIDDSNKRWTKERFEEFCGCSEEIYDCFTCVREIQGSFDDI